MSSYEKIKQVFDQWVCIHFDTVKNIIDSYTKYLPREYGQPYSYENIPTMIVGIYCQQEGFADFIRESNLIQDQEVVDDLEAYFNNFKVNLFNEQYLEMTSLVECIELNSEDKLLEFIMIEMNAVELFVSIDQPTVLK